MQITADISKIWKTLQRDLIFIFDVLLRSTISFVSFLVPWCVENVVSLTRNGFFGKRGGVTMRKYVEMCKGICGCNLMYNFFCIPFAIKKFSFCGALFKRFSAWEESTSKTWFLD